MFVRARWSNSNHACSFLVWSIDYGNVNSIVMWANNLTRAVCYWDTGLPPPPFAIDLYVWLLACSWCLWSSTLCSVQLTRYKNLNFSLLLTLAGCWILTSCQPLKVTWRRHSVISKYGDLNTLVSCKHSQVTSTKSPPSGNNVSKQRAVDRAWVWNSWLHNNSFPDRRQPQWKFQSSRRVEPLYFRLTIS